MDTLFSSLVSSTALFASRTPLDFSSPRTALGGRNKVLNCRPNNRRRRNCKRDPAKEDHAASRPLLAAVVTGGRPAGALLPSRKNSSCKLGECIHPSSVVAVAAVANAVGGGGGRCQCQCQSARNSPGRLNASNAAQANAPTKAAASSLGADNLIRLSAAPAIVAAAAAERSPKPAS